MAGASWAHITRRLVGRQHSATRVRSRRGPLSDHGPRRSREYAGRGSNPRWGSSEWRSPSPVTSRSSPSTSPLMRWTDSQTSCLLTQDILLNTRWSKLYCYVMYFILFSHLHILHPINNSTLYTNHSINRTSQTVWNAQLSRQLTVINPRLSNIYGGFSYYCWKINYML